MRKLFTAFLLLSVYMVGCSTGQKTEEVKEPEGVNVVADKEEVEEVENDGEKILTIAAGRDFYQGPTKLSYLHKTTNVWESLMKLDEDMNPEVELAESMRVSEDGLTWTIVLPKGIKFHDGTELTAEVAKINLERTYHFSPKEKKSVPEYKNIDDMGDIQTIKVVDDYTLQVTHTQPVPDFDSRLAYTNGQMFSLASFNEDGQIETPYGSGPVKFESYDAENMIITLSAFEDYRKGDIKLDGVIFKNIKDADTRLAALKSGEIDVIADVGAIMPAQAKAIETEEELVLKEKQVSTNHYFYLNRNEGKAFASNQLREAFSLSIPRDIIVETLLEGYGAPATSVITDLAKTWYKDVGYTYDVEAAKTIIEKELLGDTQELVILLNSSFLGRWPYQDTALLMLSQLEAIGLKGRIETVDSPTWADKLAKGEYDITLAPYTITTGEPNFFFGPHMSTTGSLNKGRSYGYSNTAVDELIEKASYELDLNNRANYYHELQDIAKTEGPLIPIWYDVAAYAMDKDVTGFELDVTFWPDLFEVDMEAK